MPFSVQVYGKLGSAVWSAPEPENFLRTKSGSEVLEKDPQELSEGFVCEITGVCEQDVCPKWTAEMIFHAGWHLVCFFHLYNTTKSGFRCPTCPVATSVLSLPLLMETRMLSDVGGSVLMFISPDIWVQYLLAGCSCVCPDESAEYYLDTCQSLYRNHQ